MKTILTYNYRQHINKVSLSLRPALTREVKEQLENIGWLDEFRNGLENSDIDSEGVHDIIAYDDESGRWFTTEFKKTKDGRLYVKRLLSYNTTD